MKIVKLILVKETKFIKPIEVWETKNKFDIT